MKKTEILTFITVAQNDKGKKKDRERIIANLFLMVIVVNRSHENSKMVNKTKQFKSF